MEDSETYPTGTVVRIRKTGEFARITRHNWLRPELKKFFLNYFADVEGRNPTGPYALFHDEVDLEALP